MSTKTSSNANPLSRTGRRTGYQNFCSKNFKNAVQHVKIDSGANNVDNKDVFRELGVKWREMSSDQKLAWNKFASGSNTMPVLPEFEQRPGRGATREHSVVPDDDAVLLKRPDNIEPPETETDTEEKSHGWWLVPELADEMTEEEAECLMASVDGYGNVW